MIFNGSASEKLSRERQAKQADRGAEALRAFCLAQVGRLEAAIRGARASRRSSLRPLDVSPVEPGDSQESGASVTDYLSPLSASERARVREEALVSLVEQREELHRLSALGLFDGLPDQAI